MFVRLFVCLFVVDLLFVVCCLLFVVCRLSFVVSCLLFVICFLLLCVVIFLTLTSLCFHVFFDLLCYVSVVSTGLALVCSYAIS